MPALSLACHLPHNTPHIPSRYNNEQTTKQTKAINNSYIYINISCKCDTNRAGHFTLDAYASRPVACLTHWGRDKMDAILQTTLSNGFFNENAWISLKISLKFVPKVQIDNIRALVQIMAWRRPGDKPSFEPMMLSLLTHICVTRPQWVNSMEGDKTYSLKLGHLWLRWSVQCMICANHFLYHCLLITIKILGRSKR